MRNWFGIGQAGFSPYHWDHLLCIFLIVFIPVLMYVFRKALRKSGGAKKVLLSGLFISETSFHVWAIYNDMWIVKMYLPLQLCSLSVLLCILLLLWENKRLFAFVYLFGVSGAFQAILTPELFQPAWHFRYIQFFLVHGFIVWTAMYYAIVRGFKISWSTFISSFILLNMFAGFVYLANLFLNSNYMFLRSKPEQASLIDYLGPYPWYIPVLELVALGLGGIMFLTIKEKKTNPLNPDLSI
ncbi:TIGR02206 family membrane protein [Fictibacillus barbaricus]|uniref:Integral membrane protein (TIGR02206 family) n=1 Tax=Fictibacillus barbaricus TaxID=182136 RepID=A0ABU1TV67_9BACL|nr:TIGR02206 family membrane protein [Fictibacillus barbaricus]MDR7071101.1 putative integral membrane protein (TIGR02206 family) [Fictibacillus barbaricus]